MRSSARPSRTLICPRSADSFSSFDASFSKTHACGKLTFTKTRTSWLAAAVAAPPSADAGTAKAMSMLLSEYPTGLASLTSSRVSLSCGGGAKAQAILFQTEGLSIEIFNSSSRLSSSSVALVTPSSGFSKTSSPTTLPSVP